MISNHPPVTIINCGSTKTPDIEKLVSLHNESTEVISWDDANQHPFHHSKAVIISGGPHLFTDSEELHSEMMARFEFLKQLEKPTLGICLGHQAIALTFGGKVYRDIERRDTDEVEILRDHPLFHQLGSQPIFKEDHCEGIWPSEQMTVLAQSEFYETEAIKIIGRPMLGVQFHPEVSGSNGEKLIENFLNWAETVQEAI